MQHCNRFLVVALRGPAAPRVSWSLTLSRSVSRRQLSNASKPSSVRRILRAAGITTGLGLGVFAIGRVSLYERLEASQNSQHFGHLSPEQPFSSLSYWKSYPLHVYALIGINIIVFLLWKIPAVQPLLSRWAVLWPPTLGPMSLIGSMFSHRSGFHLLANMLVLKSFGPPLTADLGSPEEFLSLYIFSGLFAGMLHAVILPSVGCIGASGCLVGVFAYTAVTFPEARIGLVLISDLLPSVNFTAFNAFLALVAIDIAGLCRLFNIGFAHAAHLGGSAFGTAYAKGLRDWLWLRWGDFALGCWLRVKRSASR